MVVVLAPTVGNICESFKHNPVTWDQEEPNLLPLMGIHKDFIANANKL